MEWLVFLLPVAALSGWLSARRHYKKHLNRQQSPFDPDYFKGLNYLLNEQPDKAIDVFIRLLEVNSETVETHLALANLFRRRGETERAIRIHQNLIARPSLTAEQRDQVLVELGLDYMSAGVLDRAEQLFLELTNRPMPPVEAYSQLLRIYQQEKNWQQAINVAKKIKYDGQESLGPTIAQFYCELAEQERDIAAHNVQSLLKQALSYDANCVRATLLEAEMLIQEKNYKKAVKTLKKVESQDIEYLPEAIPLLEICYINMTNLDKFREYLLALSERHPAIASIHLVLSSIIKQQYDEQEALDYLHKRLQQYPSLEGLNTMIELGNFSSEKLIPLMSDITNHLIQQSRRYVCRHCGFSGKTLHWHCPTCKQWGTIRSTEINLNTLDTKMETS